MRVEIADNPSGYDCLYVATTAERVLLSCPGRLLWEREQGLKSLVVALFEAGEWASPEEIEAALAPLGADYLVAGVPRRELASGDCGLIEPGPEDGQRRHAIAELLNDLRYRTRPRHAYLPLGAGGHVDQRIVLEAGIEAFQDEAPRNVFLYEERPQLFVPSAVRIRLGQLGARLPPGAADVRDGAGLVRYALGFVTARYLRRSLGALDRLRWTRQAARDWRAASQWQPQKALGLRLQPVLQAAEVDDVGAALERLAGGVRALYGGAERAVRQSLAYSRRLGRPREYVERYWLLLPPREEGGVKTVPPATSTSAA